MAEENNEVVKEVVEVVPDTPDPTALASDGQILAAIATLSTQVSIGLETVNARIDALVSQPPPAPAPEPEPEPVVVVAEVAEEPKPEEGEEKAKHEPKRRKAWLD